MMIVIDAASPDAVPVLLEPGNFRTLKAIVSNSAAGEFAPDNCAQKLGFWEGEHLWIDPQRLVRLASVDGVPDEEWHAGFRQMLSYAKNSGWVNDQGHVRVHIEYV